MTHPAVILTFLILAAVAVLHIAGRRSRVEAPTIDRRLKQWSTAVAGRLPEAVSRIQLPTNVAEKGREAVRITNGRPLDGIGWQWRIQTPGGATIADVRGKLDALASAVNRPTPLVAVMDVQADPTHEGWGTLRAYRADPIHTPRSIAEVCEPGQRLMQTPTGSMLVGVTRWGHRVRLPLHQHSTIVYGMTRAGKSSAVQTMLVNLLPHVADGTARIRFVDVSAKQGMGYGWMRADSWFHQWATTPKGALEVMASMAAELGERATDDVDTVVPISRRNPLDVLIVEEGPAFLSIDKAPGKLTDLARQVAALGGVIVFVSQGAVEVPVTLRRQMRTAVAFRGGYHTETQSAFGAAVSPGPHTIPATTGVGGTVDWRGVSYVDEDGTGAQMVRWWHVEPDWLRAHARALTRH